MKRWHASDNDIIDKPFSKTSKVPRQPAKMIKWQSSKETAKIPPSVVAQPAIEIKFTTSCIDAWASLRSNKARLPQQRNLKKLWQAIGSKFPSRQMKKKG